MTYLDDGHIDDWDSYFNDFVGNGWMVEYDERTGVAYSRPSIASGADGISDEEIDWLGLGPSGEHMRSRKRRRR